MTRFNRRALACAAALAFGLSLGNGANAVETINGAVSAAAESNHVFCSRACSLRSIHVTTGAVAGYLLLFNATAAPVDGAVTPQECVVAPANTTTEIDYGGRAEPFATGLSAVFSTTGCFTKTASATAFFKALKQ